MNLLVIEGFPSYVKRTLEQSIFYGGLDIHDRHRDMRLDIDNMSYEVCFP
jgi:hypothetical protein